MILSSNAKARATARKAMGAITMANGRIRAIAISSVVSPTIESAHGQRKGRGQIMYRQLTKEARPRIYERLNRSADPGPSGRIGVP